MVEPYIISQLYITKQLEYITKDRLATHTIIFKLKTALFFSFLVVPRNCLYVAQASSSFERLNTCTPMHTTPTFITEAFCLVTYVH